MKKILPLLLMVLASVSAFSQIISFNFNDQEGLLDNFCMAHHNNVFKFSASGELMEVLMFEMEEDASAYVKARHKHCLQPENSFIQDGIIFYYNGLRGLGYSNTGKITEIAGIYLDYTHTGEVSRVGKSYLDYQNGGKVSRIGNLYIEYIHDRRISRIGPIYVDYTNSGQVSGIGHIFINYDSKGRLKNVSGHDNRFIVF